MNAKCTSLGFARAGMGCIFLGMSAEISAQLILMAGVFGVLVVILIVLGSISRILIRLERRMSQQEAEKPLSNSAAGKDVVRRKSAYRADFLTFLGEDPERRSLPKREQFAAFRQWRKDKGLSWPQSPEVPTEL